MEPLTGDSAIFPEGVDPKLNAHWLAAPDERAPTFFPFFSEISVAVQSALRERVPHAYFADVSAFTDTKTAYPMLVYQSSRPFRGRLRTELTYDVLNPQTLAVLFRSVKVTLPEMLDGIEARLRVAGSEELALKYTRRRAQDIAHSVQRLNRSRKCLYVLIRAEALLVNALLDLGGLGLCRAKEQARRIAAFEKKWNFQLRRLYPGTDFTWLAPALFGVATDALVRCQSAETLSAGVAEAERLKPESGAL